MGRYKRLQECCGSFDWETNKRNSRRYWGKYGEKLHPGVLQKDLNADESSRASNPPGITLHINLQESILKVTCFKTKPFLNLTTERRTRLRQWHHQEKRHWGELLSLARFGLFTY